MVSIANTATLVTNFNVAPYYEDFDETKNFHRILFRPGLAVQARELTQMQSIMQNQVDRFAEHIFKEGSPVRGCEINLDNQYSYVKLRNNTSTGATANVNLFDGKLVKGSTSGVLAKVIRVNEGSEANTPNFKTLFVKYVSSNTTTGFKSFANNEILTAVTNPSIVANTIAASATGLGAAVTVASGVVFAKDHFVRVDEQTVILDKYSNSPSYRIGFNVDETIVSSVDDTTLLDPASGSYNYAAPGANRLKLTPSLTKIALTGNPSNNFVELIQVKNGVIQTRSDTPQYAAIRDYVAKRTAEESGNYIVNGMTTRVREHLKSGNNQGVFTVAEGGDSTKLSIDVEPGKAYIQGYDNQLLVTRHVAIDKANDFASVEQAASLVDYGNYVIADNVVGNWDVNGQDPITLRGRTGGSAQANAVSTGNYSTTTFPGASIGTARVRGVGYYTGTPGLPSAQYKVYLTDIKITTAGKSFANVESIAFNAGVGGANGKADIVGSNNKNANTADSAFDRAVFRLPAAAIRRLRDTSGNVDADYTFYKSFDISFGATGQVTLNTGSAEETFSGSGALSDAAARERFHIVVRSAANTSNLSGTVTVTSGSNTVTGSSTSFTTEVNPGDIIACSPTDKFIVSEVTDNTNLKLISNAAASRGGTFHKRFIQGQVLDIGGVGGQAANRVVNVTSSTAALVDVQETTSSGFNATVVTKLNKVDSGEASKTVNRDRLVQVRVGAGGGTSYVANTTGPWPIGLSDGFRLVSVRKKNGSNFSSTTEGTDVTSEFTLDNGQRDSFYDHARLVKKPGSALSISSGDRLLVKLDYFSHSNRDRGYFSIDSYPVDDATAGSDTSKIYTYQVPVYSSPLDGSSFDLRDCVDFRPRVTDTANSVTSVSNISINPLTSTSFDEPTGGLRFPPTNTDFESDLDYYLKRNDLIVITKDGDTTSVRGTPSLNPITPSAKSDMMPIASVELAPYPSLPDEIARRNNRLDLANTLRTIKNERFTMRDIGAIRDRVDRLEYYTTLSLLEKQAKDTLIQNTSGFDRFKNGFLVDGFAGHSVGNVYDADYKISIDPVKREARPPVKLDNIELTYSAANSSNIVRTNVTTTGVSRDQVVTVTSGETYTAGETVTAGAVSGTLRYQVGNRLYIESATGNFSVSATALGGSSSANGTITAVSVTTPGRLMTLPYNHERVISQPYASTTRNTAGLLYNWIGSVALNPNSDYWVETTVLPDVQSNLDNNSDNWLQLANAWGTQWGSWEQVVSGVPQLQNAFAGATSTQTFIQNITQNTVGSQVGVSVSQQTQSQGNVIRNINIQPFMRSRVIQVTGRALKPSTRLYAFFDGTSVSGYITPANSSFANTANEGSALRSDANGNFYGLFRVPNDDSLRFRTGEKIFRLSDNPTNATGLGLVTTSGQTVYASQGLAALSQELTIGTVQVDIAINNQADTNSNDRDDRDMSSDDGGDDPIAQTFTVDTRAFGRVSSSGAYLTKVDLYFASKDDTQPVTIELREVDPASGYPTPRVVPYGRVVVNSSDVNVSSDGSSPTPIYFPAPVYLIDGRTYSITVIPGGGNPNYRVWISRLGENDLTTGTRITSQPAAGVLFASSNDRIYTAIQEEDLKFNLYFANFNVASSGNIVLKNERRDFMVIADQTSGFNKAGEEVRGETYLKAATFSNAQSLFIGNNSTWVVGATSGARGILRYYSTANGDARVYNVQSASGGSAAFVGGEFVRIRLQSATGKLVGNSTPIKFATYPSGRVTYYDAVTASNTFLHLSNVSFSNSGPAAGTSANNRTFIENRYVRGQTDGTVARIVSLGSLNMDVLNVRADFLSPSNTAITTSGKFAKSTSTRDSSFINLNINADTDLGARRYVLSRSVESNTSLSSATMKDGSAEIKFALSSTNRYASPAFDTSRVSLISIENLISSNAAIGDSEDNVKSGGDSKTRYITRRVTLAEGQDAEDLKLYVDAYRPAGTQVYAYYKVLHREDSDTFNDARWIPMSIATDSTVISDPENRDDFVELEFDTPSYGTYNSGQYANSSPTNIVYYRNSQNALFSGFKYFAVKIVLTSESTSNPPRIRDLRVIALQK
jgi:hypothetical protein